MRILIFCPYYPPHIGGLETHADEFNKYLSQKGVDITVFTPRLPEDAPENEIKYKGVKIIRFPVFEIIANYPLPKFWKLKFWKLFLGIFREKFDIVISRTRFFSTSILALIYSKIKKVKWIHIEHGSDFASLNNPLFSKVAKLYDYIFGRLILAHSDKNIANSAASAIFCQKLVSQKNCGVIYRGVEIEKIMEIRPDEDLKNKYSDEIIITFIGRLIDGKGVSDLLQAFSEINSVKVRCFIIGDGPQKENLKKLAVDLKISDKIIFFGYKKLEEAIGILKISDIFVNPSYTEGLPTSVIEAALCKKAIIATYVGGTPEIITNNKSGFLIDAGNIELLKEKIEILIRDKNLREKFENNAFDEVMDKFNWNISINKYLEIFEKVKNITRKKIYFLSSRHGGPFKQHKIIAEELQKKGFRVDHRDDFFGWLKLHFVYGKNKYIITNVPLLLRFTSRNFIFNIKGNYQKEKNIFKNPLGYLYGLNKLWSGKIILPSNYLREKLNIPEAIIIPNAVSKNLTKISQENRAVTDNDNITLIMVTMFGFREKAEGVLKIIECLSKLRTNKNITLNIFGSGSFEGEMKKRAEKIDLPANIKVFFRGYTKNIEEEYKKSDIFTYWSDLDVMPNVFLEAMTFGLPIIANDFPSFFDILETDNIIVHNENEFSEKLEGLIDAPERIKEISRKNFARIEKFNIKNISKEWIKMINQ